MLVFSSALVTESSASSGSPCHCRAYRSSTRAALASKSGARGKIQLRWDQGRIASVASQRQMVVPEIAATRPRVMTSSRMSGTCRRESGRPRRLGSSQAIALTSMTTPGGKDAWPSSPGSLLEAAEPLGEEAFAPLGDDLAAGVQTGPDLVVVEARSRHEHDLGPYDIPIRQRVPAGLGFQHLAFLVAQLDDVWAFPGHRSPSLERYTLVELGSLRCRTSVAMYLATSLSTSVSRGVRPGSVEPATAPLILRNSPSTSPARLAENTGSPARTLAPTLTASSTSASSPEADRTSTLTCGDSSTIRRIASTPRTVGRFRSISTTSGMVSRACSIASPPSCASATTTARPEESRSVRTPSRQTGWSSTTSTRTRSSPALALACDPISLTGPPGWRALAARSRCQRLQPSPPACCRPAARPGP